MVTVPIHKFVGFVSTETKEFLKKEAGKNVMSWLWAHESFAIDDKLPFGICRTDLTKGGKRGKDSREIRMFRRRALMWHRIKSYFGMRIWKKSSP